MEMKYMDDVQAYLQKLVGQTFQYGGFIPYFGWFDLAFGELTKETNLVGIPLYTYCMDASCPIKIICRNGKKETKTYFPEEPKEGYLADIQKLIGLTVKGIALREKNDLWIELEKYWIVLVTDEDSEESWRFFTADPNSPHLVVSDTWLELGRQKISSKG